MLMRPLTSVTFNGLPKSQIRQWSAESSNWQRNFSSALKVQLKNDISWCEMMVDGRNSVMQQNTVHHLTSALLKAVIETEIRVRNGNEWHCQRVIEEVLEASPAERCWAPFRQNYQATLWLCCCWDIAQRVYLLAQKHVYRQKKEKKKNFVCKWKVV